MPHTGRKVIDIMDSGSIIPTDDSYFQNLREKGYESRIKQLEAELADSKEHHVRASQQLSDAFDSLFVSNKQLAEARAEVDALRMGKMSPCDYYTSKESEENLCRELAERDKLIEQMQDAISDLLRHAEPPQHDIRGCIRANCWWCYAIRARDAALSAAERMGK